jgi:transcriptional regulator with XRE-family HTH domain
MLDSAAGWKNIRKQLNLTLGQAADMLGVTPAHLSRIENGIRPPNRTLYRLAAYQYPACYKQMAKDVMRAAGLCETQESAIANPIDKEELEDI